MTPQATMNVPPPPAPTWDLESIFQGGSGSAEFLSFRHQVKASLSAAEQHFATLPAVCSGASAAVWEQGIALLQSLHDDLELVASFAHCLTSQNVADNPAHAIESEADELIARLKKLSSQLESASLKQTDADWQALLARPSLQPIAFYLNEQRVNAKAKMDEQLESLALDLSVSGLHAWNRMYDKMAGELMVDFETAGSSQRLSLGQLATKMGDPDRAIRRQAFEKLTGAWQSRADLTSTTLNSLAGFRLALNKRRKWDSVLYEPLTLNRLSEAGLQAMWRVIQANTHRLVPYINAKKKLLGIDAWRWYDEFAPCGASHRIYPYDMASAFIVENAGSLSGHFSEFCKMAIDKRWVEAEDRAGKKGGGYCTGMGARRESRIFMTYANTYENLLTLAHELGHAYHSWVLRDQPYFAGAYPMTLAETASIISELLITDAALAQCSDPQEKLMLLDQKLQQPFIFFCDLQSRYLFEIDFYRERQAGFVDTARLSELMISAQKRAFAGMLDESGYHPLFWCSKLHFHLSEVPFYNFPYVVGFLFATGVYDRAKKEGKAFAQKYQALLMDTGSMTTDDVARKHLGVDLSTDSFWQAAVDRALADVDQFALLASTASSS